MSETLTNNTDQASITTDGTFNDEPERVGNSTVNIDTFMGELDSLVDQPIVNEESSSIENNGLDEPKKVETKNVDIDKFLGELDSLIDDEPLPGLETVEESLDVIPPEPVLEPVLMTELESKQVSELETVMAASDIELGAEPVTELVVPESLKLSDPAQQDVVDSNEKFKNVQENFATVPSSSSSNGLENTKIKDGKLYLPAIYLDSQTNKKLSRPIYRRWRPAVCEFEFGAFLCCMFYYL